MSTATLSFAPVLPSLPVISPRLRQQLRNAVDLATLALGGTALAAALWLALAIPGLAAPGATTLQARHAPVGTPAAKLHRPG